MIKLTKFNSESNKRGEFILNAELIQTIESTPDTVITLVNEKNLSSKSRRKKSCAA